MSQDFIAQYITTINNGIAATFSFFAEGQYNRAVQSLIPVLCYTIPSNKKNADVLDEIIEKINNIPQAAEKFRRGDTESEKDYTHKQAIQTISKNIYQDAIREIKEAIKDNILQGAKSGYGFTPSSEMPIAHQKPASKNFTRAVKQLEGNGPEQIPPPIAEGMIRLHAYRGSGQGVAHAALGGSRVSEVEAELVLNLVASYVTYLVDFFPQPEDETPF